MKDLAGEEMVESQMTPWWDEWVKDRMGEALTGNKMGEFQLEHVGFEKLWRIQ